MRPNGFRSFVAAMPVWLKEKLYLKTTLKRELAALGRLQAAGACHQLLFAEHHQSHAASAFYFSPFDRAAVLCLDGVGEWATTSTWVGNGKDLKPLWEIDFPHSLGPALLGLHLLHRLQGELRRVQADGPGALWPARSTSS